MGITSTGHDGIAPSALRQTVLLFAADADAPRAWQAALTQPGVQLLAAATPEAALAILRAQDLALIIIEPPGGQVAIIDLCRRLHRERSGRSVPILCVGLSAADAASLQPDGRPLLPHLEVLPTASTAQADAMAAQAAEAERRITLLLERDAAQRRLAQAQHALAASRQHHEAIMSVVGDGVIGLSEHGRILFANAGADSLLGSAPGGLIGRPFHAFYPLQGETDGVWQYTPFFHSWLSGAEQRVDDAFFRKIDGDRFPVAFHCRPMPVRADGIVVGFRDLSLQRQLEGRLRRQAVSDPLTGLSNRDGFRQMLEQAVARAQATAASVALLSIDLDRFDRINSTLGHDTGDAVLQAVARRLQECVGESDLVARTGGDEFAIILADLQRSGHDGTVAEAVLSALRRPFGMPDGLDITIGASIGMAGFPADGSQAEAVLRCAEVAMRQAKIDGRNQALRYLPEMNSRAGGRMALEQALRVAVDARSFTLDYQPQVDLSNGNLVGFEALLRWEQDGLGRVSPSKFVPMLEETGLIVPVGRWVFESGCQQRQQWADRLPDQCSVSINLSPRQFTDKHLASQIRHVLEVNELPPYRLEIELTESMLMLDREYTHGVLHALKDMGLKLSVDDFGTGYSSLAYLKLFALDALKIDKQFIDQLTTSKRDAAIATSIIQLGHNLGLQVIAEGVETLEQVTLLRELGCDVVQGYYFGQPLPADEVTSFPHRMQMH